MQERRADEASRDVTNWLKCYFMQRSRRRDYRARSAPSCRSASSSRSTRSSSTASSTSASSAATISLRPARHTITGERGGQVFRLADRIEVKVARVDLETSRIDFVLPDAANRAANAE
jgi:ribonuclease R